MDPRGIAMVALAAASWGTWSLFLRPTHLSGGATSAIVFLLMGLSALPLALRDKPPSWDRATVGWFVAYVVFDAANLLRFFGAIDTTTVAIAVLSHYLAPLIIALAAPKLDGIRVPGAGVAAIVALAGLVIVLAPWAEPARGAVPGVALGAGSAVCYAGNVFSLKRVAGKLGPSRAMAYHSFAAGLLLLPFALHDLPAITPRAIGILAIASSTIGSLSGIVFAVGLQRIGSARAAILTFAEPVVAVLVGAIAFAEPLRPLSAVGGALILAAGIHGARKSG